MGASKRAAFVAEHEALCDELADESEALSSLAPMQDGSAQDGRLARLAAGDHRMLLALDFGGSGSLAPDEPEPFPAVRERLIAAARALPPRSRVRWHGGPVTLRWALMTRLAATWAAADSLAEATSQPRRPPRRAIVDLAVMMTPYDFLLSGRPAPDQALHVRLEGPDGDEWTATDGFGEPAGVVRGRAVDLCRIVTGRATLSDTTLVADGDLAERWLTIADALRYGFDTD